MKTKVVRAVRGCVLFCALSAASAVFAQSNVLVRIIAANLPGNSQEYGPAQIRILQGLKPDIVCIQEFNYLGNSAAEIRSFVDTAFGPTFQYTRETNAAYQIPNGVISRYPIIAAGSWDDSESPNRGFAWARIDLPGTNDLLAVSVHLLTSDSATRGREAAELRAILQTNVNVPPSGWIVVGGDFNTDARSESAITTLTSGSFLSDAPIPADGGGDPDTNLNRNKPYDYVLPSASFAARLTNVVIGASSFPDGLVFDSRVYANLGDVSPVQLNDSADGQHMAVIKDFLISPGNATHPPAITVQPLSQTNSVGADITFTVTATGAAPLSYQWRHTTTNVPGATTSSLMLTNIQTPNAGVYSVVITNIAGSVTSSNALLVITTTPVITNQPRNQIVNVGENATFTVGATGPGPLGYQWRFWGTNLPGATGTSFTRINTQLSDAGNYSVVITNSSASVTSSVAVLTVTPISQGVIAQWDFNSIPPDGSTTTGTTNPSSGAGTASLVTTLMPTFAAGSATDPASIDNSGWNTTGYPSATTGNKTAGVRFDISTVGKQNLVVRWDQRVSNTGSKYSRLQYTTNGSTFLDFPTAVGVVAATNFEPHTNHLGSLPGVNNNPDFGFRIVNEFEITATGSGANAYVAAQTGSTYNGTMGTTRFDMVTLFGDSITATNPPAVPPTLSNVGLASNYFHLVLTGSSGSNYIVQATTDLGLSNWVSLQTNAAPLFFSETNQFQQRFYRGLVAP